MAKIKLTSKNFEKEVLKSDLLVLVDFWAAWCGPCQAIAPIVDELAEKYKDKLKVGGVEIDEEQDLAVEYGVMSIPTLKIFKQGKVIKEMIGFQGKERLEKMVEKALG